VKGLSATFLAVFLALGGTLLSSGSQTPAPKRPPAPPLLDVVQGLYINQLQQQVELNDDQFVKVAALLKEYLREQNEIGGQRRARARNQLVQAINRNAPDEELVPLIKDFDQIEVDRQASLERFYTSVDPLLQTRQRAKLRIYIVRKEDQIRQLIQAAQIPAPPPRP